MLVSEMCSVCNLYVCWSVRCVVCTACVTGETALHVACCSNNAVRVRELLCVPGESLLPHYRSSQHLNKLLSDTIIWWCHMSDVRWPPTVTPSDSV